MGTLFRTATVGQFRYVWCFVDVDMVCWATLVTNIQYMNVLRRENLWVCALDDTVCWVRVYENALHESVIFGYRGTNTSLARMGVENRGDGSRCEVL